MSMYPNMEKMPIPDPQAPPQQHYEPPPPYNMQEANAPPQQMAQPMPTQVTVLVDNGKFGPFQKAMKCYHCGQQVMTVTKRKAGTLTWALCSLLCLVGCFCGCCLIPFCSNPANDIVHSCPNCKNFLGAYERIKFRR